MSRWRVTSHECDERTKAFGGRLPAYFVCSVGRVGLDKTAMCTNDSYTVNVSSSHWRADLLLLERSHSFGIAIPNCDPKAL